MTKAYVFGPIHVFGKEYLSVYKHLMELCREQFDEVIGTWPDFWESEESPKEFYERTYREITKCDLFIGEVSSPSLGVGMEFQMAQEHGIPCIALVKQGIDPSSMVLGIPCTRKVLYYTDLDDLSKKLRVVLKEFSSGARADPA